MFKSLLQRFKKPTQAKLNKGDKISLKTPKKAALYKDGQIQFFAPVQPCDILTVIGGDRKYILFEIAKNSIPTSIIQNGATVGISKTSLICLEFDKK